MNRIKKQQWQLALALLGIAVSQSVGTSQTAHAEPPGGTAGWTQSFNEDFNGMTKNGESFTTPNGNKWATVFFWGSGQIFDGSGNYYSGRDMYVSNGNLVMPVVRNSDGTFTGSLANTDPRVSGQTSAGTFTQMYGYFEARVKISMTDGDASYFGLPPASQAWPPEIEIFEIPAGWSQFGQGIHFLSMTENNAANKAAGSWWPGGGFRFQDDYHIFACRWEPGLMIFYVDGIERFRTEKGVPAEASFLNLGHGCGNDGGVWNGNNNNGTWPQNTLVDWVRVWRNTGSVPVPPVPAGEAFQNLGWTATASGAGGGPASNAVDTDPWSRWSTGGRVTGGEWLSLDFKRKLYFNQIVLDNTGFANDHARGVSVYVSNDGVSWGSPIYSGAGSVVGGVQTVTVPNQNAQYVRVVNTGDSGGSWWSVGTVRVISSGINGSSGGGTAITAGVYRLALRADNRCLDAYGSGDGGAVGVWSANGGANQRWKVTPAGNGEYYLEEQRSLKVLDDYNNGGIGLWSFWGGANQRWRFVATDGGFYQLQNVGTGKVAGVNNSMLQQQIYNGSLSQQWKIVAP